MKRPWLAIVVMAVSAAACRENPVPAPRSRVTVRALEAPQVARAVALYPGETLGQLLVRAGVGAREVVAWLAPARSKLDARRLPAWTRVVVLCRWGVEPQAVRVTLERNELVLEKDGAGTVGARLEPRPVRERFEVKRGTIDRSLFATFEKLGEGDELATAVAEIFAWQVDFHRDLRRGDQVTVAFVRRECDGELVGYGQVLAATLVNAGKTLRAFRFAWNGSAGYYDENGRPLRRQFLRSPLPYSRVTSGFSLSRRHPLLGRRLPHFGVDYAAPEGTPVRATADGVVAFVGVKGGGGKTVEVRHPGGFVTAYLHLSRFASGLAVGKRVGQGEVIGYVGSTGLATGPHLDYRVLRNGRFVNPARMGSDPPPPLSGSAQEAFQGEKARLEALLAGARGGEAPGAGEVFAGGG